MVARGRSAGRPSPSSRGAPPRAAPSRRRPLRPDRERPFQLEPTQPEIPTMRVMVIVKASRESEQGIMPSTELLTAMGNFNEELVKAGVMLAGDGLQPSAKGKRIRFEGSKRS